MNEDISLSNDEIDALLGDSTTLSTDDSASGSADDEGGNPANSGAGRLSTLLSGATSSLQQSLSQVLGEEVTLSLQSLKESKGVSADGSAEWYIALGSFSNNGHCDHVYLFPSDIAHRMATQYSGVADLEDEEGQVSGPLAELSQGFMDTTAKAFGTEFKGDIGAFQKVSDLSPFLQDVPLLRVSWNLGENTFFEFFNKDILRMVFPETEGQEVATDTDAPATNANQEGGPASPQGEDTNNIGDLFGMSSNSDSSISLGDALLGTQSVSDVSLPSFDGANASQSANNPISMLMDVAMDVTVELGSTKKIISEILGLNRGSIIELKKLAGEPLDIKINNKLIARGEVVVIDEYFGVRVIEIVSPKEKLLQ